MVQGTHLPSVLELEEPIGYLGLDAADNKWTAFVDGIAYDLSDDHLLAASIAGGSTEIKAWRAAFGGQDKIEVTWTPAGGKDVKLKKDPDGYTVHIVPLGMNAWHLVAVSKRDDFLPCVSEEAVWQNLLKRTTTPLDRAWMPALVERLGRLNRLTMPTAHGRMKPGLLSINTDVLDQLVKEGLRNQRLKIAV